MNEIMGISFLEKKQRPFICTDASNKSIILYIIIPCIVTEGKSYEE